MKKILFAALILALMVSLGAGALAAGENIVKNGNFEGSDLTNFDFQPGMPNNEPIIVEGKGRNGSKALQYVGDVDDYGWPDWTQMRVTNLTLERDKTYVYSGWIYSLEDMTLDCQLYLPANTQHKHAEVYWGLRIGSWGNGIEIKKDAWTYFEIEFVHNGINPETGEPYDSRDAQIITCTDWSIFFQYYTMAGSEGSTFPRSPIYFDDISVVEKVPATEGPGQGGSTGGSGQGGSSNPKTGDPGLFLALFGCLAAPGALVALKKKK